MLGVYRTGAIAGVNCFAPGNSSESGGVYRNTVVLNGMSGGP